MIVSKKTAFGDKRKVSVINKHDLGDFKIKYENCTKHMVLVTTPQFSTHVVTRGLDDKRKKASILKAVEAGHLFIKERRANGR